MNKAKCLQEPEWSRLSWGCHEAEYIPKNIQTEILKNNTKTILWEKKDTEEGRIQFTFLCAQCLEIQVLVVTQILRNRLGNHIYSTFYPSILQSQDP